MVLENFTLLVLYGVIDREIVGVMVQGIISVENKVENFPVLRLGDLGDYLGVDLPDFAVG